MIAIHIYVYMYICMYYFIHDSSQALDIRRWFGFVVMVETLISTIFFSYTFAPIESPQEFASA